MLWGKRYNENGEIQYKMEKTITMLNSTNDKIISEALRKAHKNFLAAIEDATAVGLTTVFTREIGQYDYVSRKRSHLSGYDISEYKTLSISKTVTL